MTTLVILSLYISGVLLFELTSSRVDGCACPENDVRVRNQTELDRYLDDEISYRRKNNATRCIQWTLTGRSYQLDMVELMKIKAVADGPVGQVLAGPVSECNKNILIISITMLT